MNTSFRSIWNQALGAWVATPETARARCKGAGGTDGGATASVVPGAPRMTGLGFAIAAAFGGLAMPLAAQAGCTPFGSGAVVECSGDMLGFSAPFNNMIVRVLDDAQVVPGPIPADDATITLLGNNVRFENRGLVAPSTFGIAAALTSGVKIGNSNNSSVSIINSGTLRGTSDGLIGSWTQNTVGPALLVNNGSRGNVTITNSGLIDAVPIVAAAAVAREDIPVVYVGNALAPMGNGPAVNMTNTGTITGRVAFQGLDELVAGGHTGNVFTNAGTINGSVSLGAGVGTNIFNALTGSSVSPGQGTAVQLAVMGSTVTFAAAGIVDSGAGGNGILNLLNGVGGVTGIGNVGVIDGASYINFKQLAVGSGAWTLIGQFSSGAGSSVQLNGGSLAVDNNAAFGSSAVSANGGALRAALAGVDVANDIVVGPSRLTVDGTNKITLSGQLSGTGGLVKSGASELVLSHASNLYTGGTEINGGTLTVSGVGALGTGGVSVTGDSTLAALTDLTLDKNVALGANLTLGGSHAMTLSGTLSGIGSLTNDTGKTLVLSGVNTHGGGVNLKSGDLVITNPGALGSGPLTVNASSGVTLSTTAPMAISNTLKLQSDLNLQADNDLALMGDISGQGGLLKMGAGMLKLSGDGSAYSGALTVQAGGLNMAGGVLGGELIIGSGASLSGSGRVGTTTLQSGATLSPSSTAPLTVAGDLTFSPGSVYNVTADPASSASSRVQVTGRANLAGSVLHVGPDGGFKSTQKYTIMAANTLNGTFDSVSSNFAYLTPTLNYGAKQVTLQLDRKQTGGGTPATPEAPGSSGNPGTPGTPIAFAEAAITSNQRSVANALDSLPAGSALHEYILTLPEGLPPQVFNSLTGEAHASVASNLMSGTASPRTLPMQRLRANLNAGMRPGAPTAQAGGPLPASALPSSNAQPAWAELIGNWQTQKDNGNAAQVRQHTGGIFMGADHEIGQSGWRLGGAVGYTDSKISVDDRSSNADVSGYSATLYGGKSFAAGVGKLNFLAGAAYTWHDVGTTRYASVAGELEKLTSEYGASTAQLFTEVGYALPLTGSTRIEPFVGFAWSDLRTRAFSESGGSAALNGHSSSDKQTSSTLGLRTQTDFNIGDAEARLHAMAGWRHAFGGLAAETTMAFEGSQTFTVAGTPIARNAALAELGAEVAMSRDTTLALTYSGQYGGGNREHGGSLNLRWRY